MSALRILLLILGLAVVGFLAKYALTGTVFGERPGKSQPAHQLERVRDRAKELEGELQRRAERAERQLEPDQRP